FRDAIRKELSPRLSSLSHQASVAGLRTPCRAGRLAATLVGVLGGLMALLLALLAGIGSPTAFVGARALLRFLVGVLAGRACVSHDGPHFRVCCRHRGFYALPRRDTWQLSVSIQDVESLPESGNFGPRCGALGRSRASVEQRAPRPGDPGGDEGSGVELEQAGEEAHRVA